jgi:hypothetical protein
LKAFEEGKAAMKPVRTDNSTAPGCLRGAWNVLSYKDPEGTFGTTDDRLVIAADKVESVDFIFELSSVSSLVEDDQALHLMSFSNNVLQMAFLQSDGKPDHTECVWMLSGVESRRFQLGKDDRRRTESRG